MNIKTYRASSIQEALALVRRDLGPEAVVLHTREVREGGLLRWFRGNQQIEVVASTGVNVPTRLPPRNTLLSGSSGLEERPVVMTARFNHDYRSQFRNELKQQPEHLRSMVEELCRGTVHRPGEEMSNDLFQVFADLIENQVSEDIAQELIERVRYSSEGECLGDSQQIKDRIVQVVENEISVSGSISTAAGSRRLVALVGPTGVGKTTTIAKLAANFRLREKKRVGLITVDTYRIAAVEQLRSYADIMDLPMEVVSTPQEMRAASANLADLDLVLLDTAGRSPRDEVRIQELKSMLSEVEIDEIHLVLSCVAGPKNLASTVAKFQGVGVSSLILTKLDEAISFGNLLSLLKGCRLPLSYLTDGQNVPDDICVADQTRLARLVVGVEG